MIRALAVGLLLAWATVAEAAIAHVQTVHKARTTTSAPAGTTTVAITPTAGNFLTLAIAWFQGSASNVTIADNQSNTWASAKQGDGDANSHVEIWYAMNIVGAATTITIGWDGGAGDGQIEADVLEFSGIVTTGALDVAPTAATGSSVDPAIASGALAQADELLIGMALHVGADTTWAVDAAGTEISENEDNDVGQTYSSQRQIVASASSETLEWTLGASRAWTAILAGFKGAVSGPTDGRRVTEAGDCRITEASDRRILEGGAGAGGTCEGGAPPVVPLRLLLGVGS